MSIVLMLDNKIMDLFSETPKQKIDSAQKHLFSKIKYGKIYLYQGSLQDYSWKKIISDIKKTYVHIIHQKMEITEISCWYVIYYYL